MANWMTHILIADKLIERYPWIDRQGLCIGSIAPDCNVENETWTQFTPPRETTHFMTGKSKTTADFDRFYHEYLCGKNIGRDEKSAFLIGYLAHLITDAAFQRMIDDEVRAQRMIARLKGYPSYALRMKGEAQNGETVKKLFGRNERMNDVVRFEWDAFQRDPKKLYQKYVLDVDSFPDYLSFLPEGAVLRKIKVMGKLKVPDEDRPSGLFFTEEELLVFIQQTAERIEEYLRQKDIEKRFP